ncbi:PAXIP1-associated glutamate-rich protein 1 isoform X1 [Narcine bancroftii]|uniref:PAXIP1-associated glutamate-rich protein 1 isoform X1 n=1 Tax=Narcine bancroftii TaxID=1343680 RepID=UPI0038312551
MHDVTIIPPDNHRPASSPVYQQCTIPPIRGAIQSMFVSCPGRHPGIARSHPISWRVPQPSPPTATGTPDRRLLEFESDGSDPNVSGTLTGSGQGTNQPSLGSVRVQALKAVATGRSALALWKGRPVPVARGSRCPGAVRSLPCPSRRQEITGARQSAAPLDRMVSPPPGPLAQESWCVGRSDDEEEEVEGSESWCPSPPEIVHLYRILSEHGRLELSARPLPRRPPTPEAGPPDEEDDGAEELQALEEEAEKPPVPTEFDFDDEPAPTKSFLGMRRSAGSSGRPPRREARLDKVLSDMKRHKRIEEQMMRSGKDVFELSPGADVTPPRRRGIFQCRNY